MSTWEEVICPGRATEPESAGGRRRPAGRKIESKCPPLVFQKASLVAVSAYAMKCAAPAQRPEQAVATTARSPSLEDLVPWRVAHVSSGSPVGQKCRPRRRLLPHTGSQPSDCESAESEQIATMRPVKFLMRRELAEIEAMGGIPPGDSRGIGATGVGWIGWRCGRAARISPGSSWRARGPANFGLSSF